MPPPAQEELDACPFCEGREDRTPPETLRLPPQGPWHVRVVPNLYPALERQEVVVHVPRHARSLTELTDEEAALIAEAWAARARAIRGFVQAVVNEGADAGSSLPHTHSQLVWLPEPPPEVARELDLASRDCPLCADGEAPELAVAERDGVALRCTWAGRLPYEMLVAPARHEDDPWASDTLAAALRLVTEAFRRLHALEGPCPTNAWLHAAPGLHWHIEVVPRLSVLAGLELGAGLYINTVRPEEAAAALRSVL